MPRLPFTKSPAVQHGAAPLTLAAALLSVALSLSFAPSQSQAADAAPAAASAAESDPAFQSAMAVFNRATQGDDKAIEPSVQAWRRLSAADPTNPVPRAYLGASTTLLATTTLLPWKKMSHAEDGLALLDKALAQLTPAHDVAVGGGVPASLLVRFTAASTFNSLPSMFNRGERGARLLIEVLQSPAFDKTPLPFKASVWMRAAHDAQGAKRNDEARQWLNKVATSGAPQAPAAQAQLKSL